MAERYNGISKFHRIAAGIFLLTGAATFAVELSSRQQSSPLIEQQIGKKVNMSPDCSRFVYLEHKSYPIHRSEVSWDTLVVVNSDGSEQVYGKENMTHLYNPQWSPDGSKILLSSSTNTDENDVASGVNPDNYSQIVIVDAITGKFYNIPAPEYDSDPRWSQDGTKIIFDSQNNGVMNTSIMSPDGSNRAILFKH